MYMTVPIFRHLAWDKYNKQILCYVMKRLIVLVCIVCNASMKTVIFFLLTLHSTLELEMLIIMLLIRLIFISFSNQYKVTEGTGEIFNGY